jgi:hypothetical protein
MVPRLQGAGPFLIEGSLSLEEQNNRRLALADSGLKMVIGSLRSNSPSRGKSNSYPTGSLSPKSSGARGPSTIRATNRTDPRS